MKIALKTLVLGLSLFSASSAMADDASFAKWLGTPGGQKIEYGAELKEQGNLQAYGAILGKHCGLDVAGSKDAACGRQDGACKASFLKVTAQSCAPAGFDPAYCSEVLGWPTVLTSCAQICEFFSGIGLQDEDKCIDHWATALSCGNFSGCSNG